MSEQINTSKREYFKDRDHSKTIKLFSLLNLHPIRFSWDGKKAYYKYHPTFHDYRPDLNIPSGYEDYKSYPDAIRKISYLESKTAVYFHPATLGRDENGSTYFCNCRCICLSVFIPYDNKKHSQPSFDKVLTWLRASDLLPTAIISEGEHKSTWIYVVRRSEFTRERINTAALMFKLHFPFFEYESVLTRKIRIPNSCESVWIQKKRVNTEIWTKLTSLDTERIYDINELEKKLGYLWDDLLDCPSFLQRTSISSIEWNVSI